MRAVRRLAGLNAADQNIDFIDHSHDATRLAAAPRVCSPAVMHRLQFPNVARKLRASRPAALRRSLSRGWRSTIFPMIAGSCASSRGRGATAVARPGSHATRA
jgi:hypothetical protein